MSRLEVDQVIKCFMKYLRIWIFFGSITNFVGFRISDVILPAHIKQL